MKMLSTTNATAQNRSSTNSIQTVTEMKIVTRSVCEYLNGQDKLLSVRRMPPTKLLETRRVAVFSETTWTMKEDLFSCRCIREINHEVAVINPAPICRVRVQVHPHLGAAIPDQLNLQLEIEKKCVSYTVCNYFISSIISSKINIIGWLLKTARIALI